MINIIYKLTNLCLKLINLIIKKWPFCKKIKKIKKLFISQSIKMDHLLQLLNVDKYKSKRVFFINF